MIRKCIDLMKKDGAKALLSAIVGKIALYINAKSMVDFSKVSICFENKCGLGIGGPSGIFNKYGFVPIYNIIKSLDMVNFSVSTVWGGSVDLKKGLILNGKRIGEYYIMDGSDLSSIRGEKYDFVLSSNNIEHMANPMRAIEQWLSVIKPGGSLVVVAPRKESNFDHNRDIVKFNHLMDDYRKNTQEDDLAHLDDILKHHDLSMDRPAGTFAQFKERSAKNFENRCLHHHVFDLAVLKEIYEYFGISVLLTDHSHTDYVIIGQFKNKQAFD